MLVRYAQEAGVHRHNRHDDKVLDEQWKRVFCQLLISTILHF